MAATRTRRRHRLVRVLLIGFCIAAVIAAGTAYYLGRQLAAPIDRIEGVFTGLEDRPVRSTIGRSPEAVNILVLGTDRRSDTPTTGAAAQAPAWVPGAQRSDAMLLVHIDGDREGASVISLPRDSWVDIPDHGPAKINAAYSYGGPSLTVATVERLTGVRIDHLAVIDWAGIRSLTDELGGVTVTIPEAVYDSARDVGWSAGVHRLDGQAALDYVGQRYGLPLGDLDRARRQQNFLRSIMGDTLRRLSDAKPWDVYQLLRVITSHLSVDAEWSNKEMAKLAWSLRGLDDSGVAFLTAPVAGFGWESLQSVVYLDHVVAQRLWDAVRNDGVSAWVQNHPEAPLADEVR
jgi:LCP family protein required for cell wall assembly